MRLFSNEVMKCRARRFVHEDAKLQSCEVLNTIISPRRQEGKVRMRGIVDEDAKGQVTTQGIAHDALGELHNMLWLPFKSLIELSSFEN